MAKPRICIPIVNSDVTAIKLAEPFADLFEVRIDLIGKSWRELIPNIKKPWIACNRRGDEGGKWKGNEDERVKELVSAIQLGAPMIDIELFTPGLARVIKDIKGKTTCLISYHNQKETPAEKLYDIVRQQLACGADICKVVTTARTFADNVCILQLIREFPETRLIAFAMGEEGHISRVLSPLVGGFFTYASMGKGKESASGQIDVETLLKIYGMVNT